MFFWKKRDSISEESSSYHDAKSQLSTWEKPPISEINLPRTMNFKPILGPRLADKPPILKKKKSKKDMLLNALKLKPKPKPKTLFFSGKK